MLGVSTIDWKTPKQWFYTKVLEAESGNDPEQFSMRVTIDDIDENIFPKKAKEKLKRDFSSDMARYYAELYATITSDEKVFSVEKLISFSDPIVKTRSVLIPYDPARRKDRSATLCVRMGETIDGAPHLHIYKEKDIR